MNLTKDWAATLDDYVIDLAWSPAGDLLAAASAGGPIALLSRDGKTRTDLSGHENGTNALAFGQLLASGGQDGSVKFWDTSGKNIGVAKCGSAWVEHLCWPPPSDLRHPTSVIAAAGRDLFAITPDGTIAHRFSPAPKTITALAAGPLSPTSAIRPPTSDPRTPTSDPRLPTSLIAAACFGGVMLFDARTYAVQREFTYGNGIHALVWSPDGKWLVSGNQDPSVHLWVPADGTELQMSGYETKVKHLTFDHTSHWLATSGGREACIWDCSGPGPEGRDPSMLPHDAPISALAFQHHHGLLATASQDGVVMLWSPERAQPLRATVKMPVAPTRLAWSPDDTQLAIGTEKGGLYILKAL